MAPSVAGTNFLTKAEDLLISTLAGLAKVQAFLGVDTVAEAKARIYAHEIPRTMDDADNWNAAEWAAIFPCVILSPGEDEEFTLTHTANGSPSWEVIASQISFSLRFERQRPAAVDEQEEVRALRNAIGDILEDIIAHNGNDGTFCFSSIKPVGACYRGSYGRESDMGVVQGWKIDVASSVQEGGA